MIRLGLLLAVSWSLDGEPACPVTESCFRCIENNAASSNESDHCYFCFETLSCQPAANASDECVDFKNKQCVEQLGGDAKDSVRQALGFTVLAIGLVTDFLVRICAYWMKRHRTF